MQIVRITEQELLDAITEQVNKYLIQEAFKSNKLRDFFQQHGGVSNKFRQFSLGDISDEQIGYIQEFDNANDAYNKMTALKKSDPYTRQRSDADMRYLFHIFTANDGTSILVGVDRNKIQTGVTWGGEVEKKVADRLWRNGWNFKTRDNRYVDDRDTYYYQSPAKDFGLHKSDDYKNRKQGIKQQKDMMGKEQHKQWRQDRLKHLRDYLQRYYPEQWKKLNK